MIFCFLWALPKLESITCSFSSTQRPTIHLPSLQCFFPLVTSCLLSLFYFCCFTTTVTTIITTTITTVSQLLLIPLCKQVFISGVVELTTHLSKPVRILCVLNFRINKLGYLTREDYLDPLQLRVIKYCFLAPLPGTIALFTSLLVAFSLLHFILYG